MTYLWIAAAVAFWFGCGAGAAWIDLVEFPEVVVQGLDQSYRAFLVVAGPPTLIAGLLFHFDQHNRRRARAKGGASALTLAMDAVAVAKEDRSKCMRALGKADAVLAHAQARLAQERQTALRRAEHACDSGSRAEH